VQPVEGQTALGEHHGILIHRRKHLTFVALSEQQEEGDSQGVKKNEIPAHNEVPAPYGDVVNELNTAQLFKEAEGLEALGLYAEAEATLRKVEANDPDARDFAQCRLVHLFMQIQRHEDVATLGTSLIERGIRHYGTIIKTMLALQFLGRTEEARDTLRLVEESGHSLEEDAYQMACFASRLGEFHEALGWLLLEFRRSEDYYAHALGDTDLRPLWEWLRDYQPTLEEAHLFIETRFKDVCAAARDKDAPIQLSADDLTHYPEGVRRLFRFNGASGYFTLNPLAVAQEPGAAAQFEHDWRAGLETVEGLIREGHNRVADVVLDAQMRYAVEHARAGNHLGARYHILWALKFRPALIWDFLKQPGLEMMVPFLADLVLANEQDATFRKRMGEVEACTATDPDRAWSLLEATPEAGRTTGLYLLRLAGLYDAEEDYESALPIWAELRRLWPDDAAAFGNAIEALRKLGRNDEARRLLAESPACYRRFRKYWAQMATLEGVRRTFPPAGCTTFRGHPDLGGVLIPERDFGFIPDGESAPNPRPDYENENPKGGQE